MILSSLYLTLHTLIPSFLLKKSTTIYNRRQSKILSTLTSQFTSSYVFHWTRYFPETPLQYPPSFDGRIVLYPTSKEVKDYFAWRQADSTSYLHQKFERKKLSNSFQRTSIIYTTPPFGLSSNKAVNQLPKLMRHSVYVFILTDFVSQTTRYIQGTFSKDKHEILFSRFDINYNTLDPRFRKGSILVREEVDNEEAVGSEEFELSRPTVGDYHFLNYTITYNASYSSDG